MKSDIPEFVKVISENDYEIFEQLFTKKYKKFRKLYWIVKDYSKYIVSLKYKNTEDDTLKISMTLAKVDVEQVLEKLQKKVHNSKNVKIWNEKKVIHIKINNDDED